MSHLPASDTSDLWRPPSISLRTMWARAWAALSGIIGAVAGVAPHVLHHVAPIAGAALISGAGGTVLFGVLGFLLTVPMLVTLRRRFGTWLAPAIALSIFIVMFTISTLWIGPAIRGDDDGGDPDEHQQHHLRSLGAPHRELRREPLQRLAERTEA